MPKLIEKEEAVKIAGLELVTEAEEVNCEFTNRVTDGTEWMGYVEFSASAENETHRVTVYYYIDEEDMEGVEDLGDLGWEIEGYEVEEV